MKSKVFGESKAAKPVIGVLQLLPLPASAGWRGQIDEVIARAEQEATALATGNIDAILVENTFDAPYAAGRMDAAAAVAMGLIVKRIMHFTQLPIGVSVLKNDPETALAIAMNVNAQFIRVGLLTGAAICDTGIIEGKYRELSAYQRMLKANNIAVYADVSLEKMIPLMGQSGTTESASLKTLAQQAIEPGGADGIILTDSSLTPEAIETLRHSVDAPVFYDFNHSVSQANAYLSVTDGLIVSRCIKKDTRYTPDLPSTVDLNKVESLMAMAEEIRTPLEAVV